MATLNNVITNANGCVGIGTSSPAQLLELKKTTGSAIALLNYNDSVKFNINASSGGAGYVGMVSNHDLIFVTNDTERARLTNTGCVGIGTTTVKLNSLLTVNGSGAFGTSAYGFYVGADATGAFLDAGTQSIRMFAGQTERMRITSGGNVGIGTTIPTGSLHVYQSVGTGETITATIQEGAGGAAELVFRAGNASTNRRGALRFYSNQVSSTTAQWTVGASMSQSSGDNSFYFYNNGSTSVLTLSQTNVGIGTTSPSNKLYVNGDGYFASTLFIADNTALNFGNTSQIYHNSSRGTTQFTGTAGSDTMCIKDSNGYVGIGTTSPNRKLQVDAETNGPALRLTNTNSNSGIELLTAATKYSWLLGAQYNIDGTFEITPSTAVGGTTFSTPTAVFTQTGNVGIGTTSPLARLHVTGSSSVPAAILMGNVGIGTTSFVYSNAARGDVEVYGSTDALISLRNATANSYLQKTGNDFYLNNGGAGFISITTNTSERMRITSDGNVGIGTSSPGEKLGILNGNIQLLATSGDPYIRLTDNGVRNWYLKVVDTSDYFEFGGTNTTSLVVKGDGNVGIGTTSPTATLDVSKMEYPSLGGILASFTAGTTTPTTEKYVYLKQTYTGAAYDSPMLAFRANANSVNSGSFGTVRTTSNGSIAFSNVNATSGTVTAVSEKMRIQADGNVGIGTSSPIRLLQVNGDQLIYANVAGAANSNKLIFGSFANNAAGAIYAQTTTGTSGDLVLAAVLSSTITEYVRIKSTGNVGIGTNNPATKLEVFGGALSSTSGSLVNISTFSSTTSNGSYLKILERRYKTGTDWQTSTTRIQKTVDVTNQAYIDFNPSGSLYGLAFGTGVATESMRITSNGAVGIGTTTPISKLHVEGPQITLNTEGSYTEKILYFRYSNGARIMSDSYLTFYTTGTPTEKMRIDANGNVGIGTTVIRSKLEIAGNTSSPPIASVQWTPTARSGSFGIDGTGVYIRNSNNGDYFDLKNASGVARFRVIYDNATHLTTNFVSIGNLSQTGSKLSVFGNTSIGSSYGSTAAPSNGMIVQGNVGIGTTNPATKLDVKGNVFVANAANGNNIIAFGNIGTLGPLNGAPNNLTGSAFLVVSSSTVSGAPSNMRFFTTTGGTCGERMRIAADGNVGIGTSTLFAKFVVSNGSGENIEFTPGNATVNGGLIENINRSTGTTRPDLNLFTSGGSNGSIKFYTNGVNERMRVASDGNVGIGTTAPAYKLDVNSGGSSFALRLLGSSVDAPVIRYENTAAGGRTYHIGSTAPSSGAGTGFSVYDVTGGAARMLIDANGNLGIGTTSPAYKLEVNGSLYATRLSGSAMFTTNGKGRFYGTASYALASAGGGSSLTGQTDSATPFETSLGHQAGNSNTGTGNTAIGYQALFSNTTGTGSIAIGYQALYSNTRGKRNIAIGYEALRTTQGSTDGFGDPIGDENVAIGYQAARAAFNINRVVAIGHRALAKNLAGGNVAIGWLAMESNVGTANSNLGILNTAVGTMALSSNTSGNANSAFGYLALNANTTGNENTAVGHRSMLYNTTGKNNCSFGSYALYYNQIANNNSAFGAFALYSNTTNNNSAFGYKALRYNTTGVNNDAFGYQALYSNISGKGNSAFGFQALKYATTATGNSAFGRSALTQCSGGGRNSAFGYYSSGAITGNPAFGGAGMDNCSFGYRALRFNNSGNNNTAVGKDALYNNKVSNQTAIGYNALLGSTTGNGGNTAVGSNAGSAITFGYRNTMIGNNAGATGAAPLTTGQNNTCLGNGAITSTATVSNEITLGNSSITTLRCQVTTITSLSDIRDKDDIIPVDVGLSFIEKLRPVTFKWDKREWYTDGNRDGSKKDTITQIGFIAQELKALQESENATYLNLVYESNPDKLEATPGNLMIPLIKAVQELNAIVKQQRVEFDDKITKQQLEIDYLKSKLNN